MAGSSVTFTLVESPQGTARKIIVDWVSDSVTGGASGATTFEINGTLEKLVTDPGAITPTAAYDITMLDEEGLDVLQGVGVNKSATVTEEARIVYSGTSDHPTVNDRLTFTVASAGNSKNGQAILYWKAI